jgi:hypothetical protein
MNWYVKGADGKVFGPADDEKIIAWVKDGRVDPFAGVSNDLKKWKLASLEPMFEMDWIVENEPGRFYGPTHRAVVDDLVKSGSLMPSCRIYRDDHGGAAEKEAASARAEAEKAMAEVQAEAEKAMAELKGEAERAIASKDAELAALKAELEVMKSRAEKSEAHAQDLERKIVSLTEAKKREWKVDVIEPEIVSEEPPPAIRDVFNPARAQQNTTLADLERQAQAELARMGASGAKKFFGLK